MTGLSISNINYILSHQRINLNFTTCNAKISINDGINPDLDENEN